MCQLEQCEVDIIAIFVLLMSKHAQMRELRFSPKSVWLLRNWREDEALGLRQQNGDPGGLTREESVKAEVWGRPEEAPQLVDKVSGPQAWAKPGPNLTRGPPDVGGLGSRQSPPRGWPAVCQPALGQRSDQVCPPCPQEDGGPPLSAVGGKEHGKWSGNDSPLPHLRLIHLGYWFIAWKSSL